MTQHRFLYTTMIILASVLITGCDSETAMKIHPQSTNLAARETLVIDIWLNVPLNNPFDPNEIKVDLEFISPKKSAMIHPAFLLAELSADSTHWQARFTPTRTGEYRYRVAVTHDNTTHRSRSYILNVTSPAPEEKGFIRQGPDASRNPWVQQFDNGVVFRGIGENVCWTDDYEYYFQKLQETGCNLTRIWMCPWNLYLEWEEPGLGRYHLKNALELDQVLDLARQYGIYIILTLEYHGVVQRGQGFFNENKWLENPYNAANGGPCTTAAELFTHPHAIQSYKNRFRYLVARYGYSPYIHSWEFWNEVDLTAGAPEDIVAWHRQMGQYLKEIDIHQHMISTSVSTSNLEELWSIPEIDYTQVHTYNSPDMAANVSALIKRTLASTGKKGLIGEYGVDFRGPSETMEMDPQNIGLHHGLWAGYFSPTPLLPLTWWWDNYIDSLNLYPLFKSLTAYDEIFFGNHTGSLDRISPRPWLPGPVYIADADTSATTDLVIFPSRGWSGNSETSFVVDEFGIIANESEIPSFIFGHKKTDMRNPPQFQVNLDAPAIFKVTIKDISQYGLLLISIDDELVLRQELPIGPGEGPWESAEFRSEWDIWWGSYNQEYEVTVPAGFHTIQIENDGLDWFSIEKYILTDARRANIANIRLQGFEWGPNRYFWLRHGGWFWKNVQNNGDPETISNAVLILDDLIPGTYHIQWWDTWQGAIIQEYEFEMDTSGVQIALPPISGDLAGKILRGSS